jgi:hypothetical protein
LPCLGHLPRAVACPPCRASGLCATLRSASRRLVPYVRRFGRRSFGNNPEHPEVAITVCPCVPRAFAHTLSLPCGGCVPPVDFLFGIRRPPSTAWTARAYRCTPYARICSTCLCSPSPSVLVGCWTSVVVRSAYIKGQYTDTHTHKRMSSV